MSIGAAFDAVAGSSAGIAACHFAVFFDESMTGECRWVLMLPFPHGPSLALFLAEARLDGQGRIASPRFEKSTVTVLPTRNQDLVQQRSIDAGNYQKNFQEFSL
jgi:hypothetical protein